MVFHKNWQRICDQAEKGLAHPKLFVLCHLFIKLSSFRLMRFFLFILVCICYSLFVNCCQFVKRLPCL